MPESLAQCWFWFIELNSTRAAGMGISAISYTEMHAYFTLLQLTPEPWEIEVIKMFDSVALEMAAEQQAKHQRETEAKARSKSKT